MVVQVEISAALWGTIDTPVGVGTPQRVGYLPCDQQAHPLYHILPAPCKCPLKSARRRRHENDSTAGNKRAITHARSGGIQRTTKTTRTKVSAQLQCWFMHGNPATRYFQMVVMIMVNKKLREHRQRAGIPLEILAYKARVSPRTLWRWERWNCTPRSWEGIQRVAAVLGVQPEDLLDDEQGGER